MTVDVGKIFSFFSALRVMLTAESIQHRYVYNVGVNRQRDHMHSDVVHVATTSPVCLYSMDTSRQHLTCIDLYDVFPGAAARRQTYRPRLCLAPLGHPLSDNIIIHDELVCVVLLVHVLSTAVVESCVNLLLSDMLKQSDDVEVMLIIIIIIRSRRQQRSVASTQSGHDDEPWTIQHEC